MSATGSGSCSTLDNAVLLSVLGWFWLLDSVYSPIDWFLRGSTYGWATFGPPATCTGWARRIWRDLRPYLAHLAAGRAMLAS